MYIRILVLLSAMFALTGAVQAQSPTRLRGVIDAFDGNKLSVKLTGGSAQEVQVDEETAIVFARKIELADIEPGDFVAVTSTKHDDGSLTAFEVRRFPKPSNPGHRPYDGRSDQTMTNATVAAMVQSANGPELTVSYQGGSQKILVPPNASISMLVPGERSQLKPGAPVSLIATQTEGGGLSARNIQVGPSS